MDMSICMAESVRCSTETTTLLIGYTPIQNKKFEVWEKPTNQPTKAYISSGGSRGESVSLPFSVSKDTCVPGLMATSPIFKALVMTLGPPR